MTADCLIQTAHPRGTRAINIYISLVRSSSGISSRRSTAVITHGG